MIDLKKLSEQLTLHEGMKCFPYVDTVGKMTIGVGRNLTDRGLTKDECNHLLQNDIQISLIELQQHFPWFDRLEDTRQMALIDMHFNLGMNRLKSFKNTLRLIQETLMGDATWSDVAKEMLNSKWATQVGKRAETLAKMMELGDNYDHSQ
jgi:lysozyme